MAIVVLSVGLGRSPSGSLKDQIRSLIAERVLYGAWWAGYLPGAMVTSSAQTSLSQFMPGWVVVSDAS